MIVSFKYGKENVKIKLNPNNVLGKLEPQKMEAFKDPIKGIRDALKDPINSPRLEEIIARKKTAKVVIIVNDITRPTPYNYILPPLLEELNEAGITDDQITFVIATGNHRGNTEEENRELYTEQITKRFKFFNHDSTTNLVSIGALANGTEITINKHVAEADMVITTGLIGLHQTAGFTGGRKSIIPGVVGKELIATLHSMMTLPRVKAGNYRDNPVHHLLMKVAQKVGVDFILNVIINSQKEIVKVVAGELEMAWAEGVDVSLNMNMVKVPKLADVAIASTGGYPKDINFYQAQKALTNAATVVKPGGTIILVAQCPDGYGDPVFEAWIKEARSKDDIINRFRAKFELGGHKAYTIIQVLKDKEVVLITDMPRIDIEELFCTYQPTIQDALDYVRRKHGENYQAWVIPEAGSLVPVI